MSLAPSRPCRDAPPLNQLHRYVLEGGCPDSSSDRFQAVIRSAARLQQLAPDAVLVGGSAAGRHARHRVSDDHDHVLADLTQRFDAVLEALESDPDWVLNRLAPGKILLGSLGDIEVGIRQLLRRHPLQTQRVDVPGGGTVVAPTPEETLRIKAYLLVKRNQTREYVDVTAPTDRFGIPWAAATLADIDAYYNDGQPGNRVVDQLQLGLPRPQDTRTTTRLSDYQELNPRWHSWSSVVTGCQSIADAMMTREA